MKARFDRTSVHSSPDSECARGTPGVWAFLLAMGVYAVLSYGGIRAADSEVVFRTAEALWEQGEFAVSEQLGWKGFGVTPGRDGGLYSIFGPAESVALAPLVGVGRFVNARVRWFDRAGGGPSPSHYVNRGLVCFAKGRPMGDPGPHASRAFASALNVVVTALLAWVVLLVVERLVGCRRSALFVAALVAFGSPLLPYSGTVFSEPLATLFASPLCCSWWEANLICLSGKPTGVWGGRRCCGGCWWRGFCWVLDA